MISELILLYKDLIIQYYKQVIEDGSIDLLDEIIHPEFSCPEYYGDPLDFGSGIDKLKNRIIRWRKSFSEKYLITQIMENEEAVFCEFTVTTKQISPWFGKKPKEKTAKVSGFALFEIKSEKISSIKQKFDYNDFWSQLGYLVDDGEYELPADLDTPSGIDAIKLKPKELKKLEQNYSVLQSSAIQYKDLLQYAAYIKNFLDISEKAIRTIAIQSVIEWQIESKTHQSDLTGLLPQELLMTTISILEKGKQKLQDILLFEGDADQLELVFDNLINFFVKEYSR